MPPKCRGSVDMLGGGAVSQRELDRLEEWPNTNCKILKKDKGHVLQLGKRNPLNHYRLGMECPGSSLGKQ